MKWPLLLLFSFTKLVAAQRGNDDCLPAYIGDSLCDPPCNNEQHKWDGGDCCPQTCNDAKSLYKCGKWGFQCVEKDVPEWFRDKFRLCFKASPDGTADPDQCGGSTFPKKVCAPPADYTQVYTDNTDNRPGGCRMSWGLEMTHQSSQYPPWLADLSICFRWVQKPLGKDQCKSASKNSCVKLGEFTPDFIDDSNDGVGNNSEGSCILTWKLKVPEKADPWAKKLMLCLKIEATNPQTNDLEMQCSWENKSRYCATADRWIVGYHDGTNKRAGGCKLQWGVGYT